MYDGSSIVDGVGDVVGERHNPNFSLFFEYTKRVIDSGWFFDV